MTRWLALSRAARLVGVPRGVLQKKIRDGELQSSEGTVSSEELLRAFPQAEVDASGAFERVTLIKETAFARRVLERTLPTQEVLAQRLFAQSQELADTRRHLVRYHELVVALQAQLRGLAAETADPRLRQLLEFAENGLSSVLATESADVLTIMDDMLKVMSARVVSGTVARVRPSDYRLSEAEKLQGYTLLCAHTAASNELEIETLEASNPQEIAAQQIVAKVRTVKPLSTDTSLLHLQTPRTNRLRFLAGQCVTLGATGAGGDAHGSYPVASCPCEERNLHFYIARRPEDAFSQLVFSGALKSGDSVTVWGPQGDFVLSDSHRPMVFAGCDAGFAPLKSLIEHALAIDVAESLALYWLATSADGHFLANQCHAWSEAFDQFEYSPHFDPDQVAGARALTQAMRADLFVDQCDYFVAGPEGFLDAIVTELRAAGVPKRQIMTLIA